MMPTDFITREFEAALPKEDGNNTRTTFVNDTDAALKFLIEPFQTLVSFSLSKERDASAMDFGSAYVADLDGVKGIIFTAAHKLCGTQRVYYIEKKFTE